MKMLSSKGFDGFSGCKMGNAWYVSLINQSWSCLPNSPSSSSVGIRRQKYAGMVMGVIGHNMQAYYMGCLHSWRLLELIIALLQSSLGWAF